MDREKIVKMVVALAAVVVIAVSLGRLFNRNSMSLSEYAQRGGGTADASPSGVQTDEGASDVPTASGDDSDASQPSPEPDEGAVPDSDAPEASKAPASYESSGMSEDDSVSCSLVGASLNGISQADRRVSLGEGFYYEPISDNLRRYMTGISFPAVGSAAAGYREGSPNREASLEEDSDEGNLGRESSRKEDSDEGNPDGEPSREEDSDEGNPERGFSQEANPVKANDGQTNQPEITFDELRYVHILHIDFDGNPTEGELICNESIAADLTEIFQELYRNEYRLEKVLLIDEYEGDDTASMEDNNTSCFNYRTVEGTDRLSKHAYGLAIDINPLYNPYITYTDEGTEQVSPASALPYADRSLRFPYKINEDDLCYKLFTKYGFTWGGNWNNVKDYQHFQKAQ